MIDNKLLTDIGENYFYAKTIVENKIELKKLAFLESGANIVGSLIVGLLIGLLLFTTYVLAIFALIYYLTTILSSVYLSVAVGISLIFIKIMFLYLLRKKLIINPISNLIANLYETKSNDA